MINTTDIANLLRPGVADVFGLYYDYPDQWKEIFDTYESDKAVEIEVEMKFLGLAGFRAEGAPTPVDSMAQSYITSYQHRYVGLSFNITRQAIVDNLYKSKFPMMVKALQKSLRQSKNILGASLLNNGFNSLYPIGDGQALFSTTHPITTGVVANTFATSVGFNEASLESAIIQIQQFQDQAGLICMTQPEKLIVPPQGQFAAERVLGSSFRTNTANNDISAVYNTQSVPKGYRVNQFINLPNSWFLMTDAPSSFKHYIRERLETDAYADPSTDTVLVKAIERYSFNCSNFRGAFASGF